MPLFSFPAARLLQHRLSTRPRRITIAIIATFFLSLLYLFPGEPPPLPPFYPLDTPSAFSPVSHHDPQNASIADLCTSFPHHLTNRIQPVLKMGHGEDPAAITAQLTTVSACFPPDHLLIFSDLAQPLPSGGHHAIDILATLPKTYHTIPDPNNPDSTIPNPDFAPYHALTTLARTGKLTPSNDPARGKPGWRLDKYKFLAGVARAWEMRPNREFYVFYETDTYVSWDGMFRFLDMFDPDVPLYMGSPSPGREDKGGWFGVGGEETTWFANGGPGFVVSRGAMRRLLMGRKGGGDGTGRWVEEGVLGRWAEEVRRDPCGDSVLGWALWKAGVRLSGYFPLFNTYAVHSLPFTERMWCQPVLTMHKLRVEDMEGLWRWENGRRRVGSPLLYADLYEYLSVASSEVRYNWDNTNWDRLARGRDVYVDSLEACKRACEDSTPCFQYHYQGEQTRKCVLQPFINLGVAKSPETVQKKVPTGKKGKDGEQQFRMVDEKLNYTSGWIKPRIERWVNNHPCDVPEWMYPSIERHF